MIMHCIVEPSHIFHRYGVFTGVVLKSAKHDWQLAQQFHYIIIIIIMLNNKIRIYVFCREVLTSEALNPNIL